MAGKKYSISAETVVSMLEYSNLTVPILEEIKASVEALMNVFEDEQDKVVKDHAKQYIELLEECKSMFETIAEDIEGTSEKVSKLAKQYQAVLSKKIR